MSGPAQTQKGVQILFFREKNTSNMTKKGQNYGKNDRFLHPLEVISQIILYFAALLWVTWIISVIR